MRIRCMNWKSSVLESGMFGALLCIALLLNMSIVKAEYGHFVDTQVIDLPENSLITDTVSDGFSGTINYKDTNGVAHSITLSPPPVQVLWGHTYPLVNPMAVIINQNFTGLKEWQGGYYIMPGYTALLSDLNGKVVKALRATRRETLQGTVSFASQWIVMAELSNNNGGGGGNQNGGNGNTTKPVEFQGFIQYVASVANALEVEVGKEGNFVKLTVDGQTNITVNGQKAGLGDLKAGDKSKGKYDPANNHALQFMIER